MRIKNTLVGLAAGDIYRYVPVSPSLAGLNCPFGFLGMRVSTLGSKKHVIIIAHLFCFIN